MKKILLACAAALSVGAAWAEYPDKPVTIVVPFAAGGPTDKVARDLAEALRKPLNATIVIENVGGAGGTLGATKVSKAAPDGYTLLLHHIGMSTSPALYRNLQYKTLDDFEYLGLNWNLPPTDLDLKLLRATFPFVSTGLTVPVPTLGLASVGGAGSSPARSPAPGARWPEPRRPSSASAARTRPGPRGRR